MKKIAPLFLVLSLVVVSGCVEFEDLGVDGVGLLGLGEPEYTVPEEISVNVDPVPTEVSSGRSLDVFFDVMNTGNTTLENVMLEKVDMCIFEEEDIENLDGVELRSGDGRTVMWSFNAPEVDMDRSCHMKYRAYYDSTANAVFNVRALDEDEYNLRQRAGDLDQLSDVRYEKTKTPAEIMVEVSEEQPMMEGDDFLVHFHIENKGDGFVDGDSIKEDGILLDFDDDLLEFRGCQGRNSTQGHEGEIRFDETDFRNGQTIKTSCRFFIEEGIGTSETGTFKMDVNYTYVKDGSFQVDLVP